MRTAELEALLFIAGRPLAMQAIAQHLSTTVEEAEHEVKVLQAVYEERKSGLVVTRINNDVQLATAPACSSLVQHFLQEEVQSDLTRPSLETLTIISYRGPLSKPELEQLRGVNCSLILRNLAVKGLISCETKQGIEYYSVSFEFLKLLGVPSPQELPDYARLHEKLEAAMVPPPA